MLEPSADRRLPSFEYSRDPSSQGQDAYEEFLRKADEALPEDSSFRQYVTQAVEDARRIAPEGSSRIHRIRFNPRGDVPNQATWPSSTGAGQYTVNITPTSREGTDPRMTAAHEFGHIQAALEAQRPFGSELEAEGAATRAAQRALSRGEISPELALAGGTYAHAANPLHATRSGRAQLESGRASRHLMSVRSSPREADFAALAEGDQLFPHPSEERGRAHIETAYGSSERLLKELMSRGHEQRAGPQTYVKDILTMSPEEFFDTYGDTPEQRDSYRLARRAKRLQHFGGKVREAIMTMQNPLLNPNTDQAREYFRADPVMENWSRMAEDLDTNWSPGTASAAQAALGQRAAQFAKTPPRPVHRAEKLLSRLPSLEQLL